MRYVRGDALYTYGTPKTRAIGSLLSRRATMAVSDHTKPALCTA